MPDENQTTGIVLIIISYYKNFILKENVGTVQGHSIVPQSQSI